MPSVPGALHLVVIEGPHEGRWVRVPQDGKIRIGRGPDNELVLVDSMVSRHHSVVERSGGKLRVRDLGSRNGTIVSGVRVDSIDLGAGAKIRIGAHVLLVSETPGAPTGEGAAGPDFAGSGRTGEFPLGACPGCGAPVPIDLSRAEATLCPHCRNRDESTGEFALGAPLPIGARLGPFHIEAELGSGATGTVYRVLDGDRGEVRSLKVLRPDLALDDNFVRRLAQEAIALASLRHPNVVRFHRIGREGPFFYLLLEYVDGTDLKRLADDGPPIAPAAAAAIGVEIGLALEFAHEHGVIHRDVKPSNVLVEAGGRSRLSDFGLARAMDASGQRLTQTGMSLGSFLFSAPELIDDAKNAGPPADQYCLAATLYYALTREFPISGRNLTEIIVRLQTVDPTPLHEKRPDVPLAMSQAIARGLGRRPGARWPSVRALVRALQPFATR